MNCPQAYIIPDRPSRFALTPSPATTRLLMLRALGRPTGIAQVPSLNAAGARRVKRLPSPLRIGKVEPAEPAFGSGLGDRAGSGALKAFGGIKAFGAMRAFGAFDAFGAFGALTAPRAGSEEKREMGMTLDGSAIVIVRRSRQRGMTEPVRWMT